MFSGKAADALTDADLRAAVRTIKRFNDPTLLAGDGMLTLYCSLRKAHGCVNAKMLNEHLKHSHELLARLCSTNNVLARSEVELRERRATTSGRVRSQPAGRRRLVATGAGHRLVTIPYFSIMHATAPSLARAHARSVSTVFLGKRSFVQRRAVARFKRAIEASEDEETRSRLVDELSISRVIDEELRTHVGMARCLILYGHRREGRVLLCCRTTGGIHVLGG
jgi:hypothetical protein